MALQRRASGELLMTASGSLADECCCGPIPPSGDCDWSVSPQSLVFDCGAQAGAFNVNVLTGSGCGWAASVTSGGAYLTINSGSSGIASGTVGFSLLSNAGVDRTAQITVVTTVVSLLGPIGSVIGVFDLTQSECAGTPIVPGAPPPPGDVFRWSISPGAATFDCPSQNGFFNVNTQLGGGWAASVISGGSFITITGGSTGSDAGTVQFSIASNSGAERGGQIEIITTIASDLGPPGSVIGYVNIAQMASSACGRGGSGALPCNWEVSNTSQTSDPCALQSRFSDVTTGAGCSWNAVVTSGAGFITITSGSSGLSSGTIAFDVAANNSGVRRNGTITVTTGAGSVFGPAGTVIGEINISQSSGNYLVIADTGFLQVMFNGFCQGMGASSPPPVFDGILINLGACTNWETSGFKSWNGFNFQMSGPAHSGIAGIIKDFFGINDHVLGFSQTSGQAVYYHKAGSPDIAGVYIAHSSCAGVPNGNPFSFTVVPA